MKTILLVTLTALVAGSSARTGFEAGQSSSVRGVWRLVSRTIPAAAAPGDRRDPFAHVPVGIQTAVQPGLLIITARHYSRTTDTGIAPRPTSEYATPGRPTVEELQARLGPFAANAGTYDLDADVLTLRPLVANDPRAQRAGGFARLRVALDGDRLSLTPIASDAGPIAAGVTSSYRRVE